MPPVTSRLPPEIPYLELAHPQAERFTRRRRVLLWAGVFVALAGSVLVLLLSWLSSARELRIHVEGVAPRHGLDPDLVEAVVYAESRGNPRAVSRAQAYGLMQLRVPTASEMAGRPVTVDELFDPDFNLELGCRYLRALLDRYEGDLLLALMAYNAGPGNVARWRRAEPDPARIVREHAYGETRAYVQKVLRRLREAKSG